MKVIREGTVRGILGYRVEYVLARLERSNNLVVKDVRAYREGEVVIYEVDYLEVK